MNTPDDILRFWFDELVPKQWFIKDLDLDADIKARFEAVYHAAAAGELSAWRKDIYGRLAEVLVLDQFSRNIYRDDPRAFTADPVALVLAQEAVSLGWDQQLEGPNRSFLYMPYMHSESVVVHKTALALFSQPGLENNLDFERRHKDIIDRFGRYPHRNEVLRRTSTADEIEFLQQPGSSF